MESTRYFCQILMKLEFSQQIFEKMLNNQISRKSVHLEPTCSMWTYGQKELTKLIVVFFFTIMRKRRKT